MSAVKLKNAAVRAINAAIAAGEIPAGVTISAELRDRRIWISIDSAPFDVINPKNLELRDGMFSYKMSLGTDEDGTPEGRDLRAKVQEIGRAVCEKGLHVTFSTKCYMAQAKRAVSAAA